MSECNSIEKILTNCKSILKMNGNHFLQDDKRKKIKFRFVNYPDCVIRTFLTNMLPVKCINQARNNGGI